MRRIEKYFRPGSVEEAVEIKSQLQERAFFLAGGTDALVFTPPHATMAIDVMHLGLNQVNQTDGRLVIGATAILRDIERTPSVVQVAGGSLAEAIRETGPWLIRNAATLVGNVCNASPSADSAPMLLALDTEVILSSGRVIPLDQFFVSPHRTILQGELVTELRMYPRNRKGHFHKHSRSKSDIAQVGVAMTANVEGSVLRDVRLALGSVSPIAMRARRSEQLLEGSTAGTDMLEELVDTVRDEIDPIDDWRATAVYRRHIVGILARRAVESLLGRSDQAHP